jgi:hypothetical protein
MQSFNFGHCWLQPMKVINQSGLGLKMPKDPEFDILDVIKLLGLDWKCFLQQMKMAIRL